MTPLADRNTQANAAVWETCPTVSGLNVCDCGTQALIVNVMMVQEDSVLFTKKAGPKRAGLDVIEPIQKWCR